MWQWVRGLTNSLATRGLCAVLSPHGPRCLIWRGTSCTFVVFAQSAFPLCRPIRGFLSGWLQPRCDPPTHLQFGRTLTLRFVASWPKASWRLARGPVAAPIFQKCKSCSRRWLSQLQLTPWLKCSHNCPLVSSWGPW